MKTKQLLALFLALIMIMTALVSCNGESKDTETTPPSVEDTDAPASDSEPAETEIMDDLGDVNFANVTNPIVTFFVRTGYESEVWVEELTDDPVNDASYWRTQAVQERLGVTVNQINQSGAYSAREEWNATLRNAVQTETHDFDAAMFYAATASPLAIEGCYLNLLDQDMLSLQKPWWNQSITKEATVYGSLFFASGSIALSQLKVANVLFYNKDIYDEHFSSSGRKDIYQVVRDGEWTIDYLHDLTASVWIDADSNGEPSSGDTVGWGGAAGSASGAMDSWVYALGCDITKIDESIGEPVLTYYNEHSVKAHDRLIKFYKENTGAFVKNVQAKDVGESTFINGKVMMQLATFNAGGTYNDADFRYGVLPLPKYDLAQEKYRSISEVTSSMVAMLTTVEDERADMIAATIELTAAEAYKQVKPVYVEVILKSQNANAPDDAEMVDLILDSMVYSFGWVFMTKIGKAFRIVDGSVDLTQDYESNKDQYKALLDTYLDGYASVV